MMNIKAVVYSVTGDEIDDFRRYEHTKGIRFVIKYGIGGLESMSNQISTIYGYINL